MFKTRSALGLRLLSVLSVTLWLTPPLQPAELPNTKPLTETGDLAAKMVAGMHTYLDRATTESVGKRAAFYKPDFNGATAFNKSVEPNRARLRKYLGVVDQRVEPRLEYAATPTQPALVGEAKDFQVFAVRWAVLPGVDAEGLLLEPKGKAAGVAVVVPHAGWTPEQVCGLVPGVPVSVQIAPGIAGQFRVLVPVLIDRNDTHSGNPKLNRQTNQPHREFVHRMAYEMGRTLPGYEVQKILAGVDWLVATTKGKAAERVAVYGHGEGAYLARFAGALDPRIKFVAPLADMVPAETTWDRPLDRNVWGQLTEFGTAELNLLCAGRFLPVEPPTDPAAKGPALNPLLAWPSWPGPLPPVSGRGGAAPGKLAPPDVTAYAAEIRRGEKLYGGKLPIETESNVLSLALGVTNADPPAYTHAQPLPPIEVARRQKRQFDQLVGFTQKLWRESEAGRKAFWAKADAGSPAAWQKSCDPLREYFHSEVIGKLPEPTMPLNPRTRQVYDEPTFTGYEVMLDVYDDVFALGVLLLPKDLKPGEKRPVVVCQHGLEGTPRHTIDVEKTPVYDHFSRRLVEQGYIVYAPQNPYIGQNTFRQLQRKANPLKLSIFSFIIRQHQRTLDWLVTLPFVDPARIAFYGLSYGGKTAMRVPAVEPRYCLSICSGDFNEWVGKNVSIDLDRSYMWTGEYEMYEFDLGHTFNYAEMAYLIAPRPFMVERGHDDGVGTDEMVSYEYAKVRYLYANRLRLPDRTEIEYQVGGHRVFSRGTFAFLGRHLSWPPR
jgi:dienelactone hydrolase